MAFTDNQRYYCMYVLATVESNCTWTSVNYNDPITLGIMQWYGIRARNLLVTGRDNDAAGWTQFQSAAPTLAQQVENNDNSNYWSTRYLTREEGNAFVTWANREEMHAVQETQFMDDVQDYEATCDNYGFPNDNIKERIFFMAMWHQSPASALRVLGSTSATADLSRLYTTAINDSVLGAYNNRYMTVKQLLEAWDGTSAPPDFGQSGSVDESEGGNTPAIQPTPDKTAWIQLNGDNLYLHDNGKTRIFLKSTAQNWFETQTAGKPITGGQTDGGTPEPTPSGSADKVYALYLSWQGRFAYSQAGGRLDPLHTGYGDCSSTIWRAYQDALGVDVGTWTGAMVGKGRRIATSADGIDAALGRAQKGDLILFNWSYNNPSYDHVEMYSGDGAHCLGHGGPGNGPTLKDVRVQMTGAYNWEIRRYIE